MKNWSVIIIIFICIGVVIFGRHSYQERLANVAASAQEERVELLLAQQEEQEEKEAAQLEAEQLEFDALTEGLDSSIKELVEERFFKEELQEEEQIHILAFGSRALVDSQNEGITPWPVILEENLNKMYEMEIFNVETVSVGEASSIEVLQNNDYADAVEAGADIVIFEPFLWNSNSGVDISHTLDSMEIIMEAFVRANSDVILYIQPSQPIYNTHFYPQQVDELKAVAQEKGYNYLDFWQNWPSVESEELLLYVDGEHDMPTQAGHELWSADLEPLFINLEAAVVDDAEED